ncbi:MAG: hypothetical protein K0S44_2532, partial [Bacteroidetes bacterium]|nr:hypothetical protein [Bacteroidota bacterium]
QPAGTYTVNVTDAQGCTVSAAYTITEPAPLTISFTSTNVSCLNGFNGSATGIPAGGTAPYTYLWSTGSGSPNVTGLIAGTYTLTVTDGLGCSTTNTITITQPTAVTVTASKTDETCNYLNNGSATATASGGTPGYTYQWQPGSVNGATISGVASGTYTVIATDNLGCTASTIAVITEPPPLAISFSSQVNVSCFGGNDGAISATPSGGTPNYSYSWSPGGATSNAVFGLAAGTYTLTITDANGCTFQSSITITQPVSPLSVSGTSTPTSCFEGSNGTATATAAGGTGPYTYNWMPGNLNTQSVTGLLAGTYTVTTTDSKGCTATNTIVVTQPAQLILTTSTVNSNCGLPTGQASVVVSGGFTPYTYSWSPSGGNASTATNLLSAPYTVTVTDNNGCIETQWANVNDNAGPAATIFNVINVTCYGGNDGAASVGVAGGTGPFTYNWTPYGGTTVTATGLIAGTYTVTVLDANGCQSNATTSPDILQPPPIAISLSTSDVSCFGGSDGTASAIASGGTPGYSYLWLPGGTSGPTVSNLSSTTYTVQVTDANSCTQTAPYSIDQPAAALSVVASATPVACNSVPNGTVNAVASGGTGPYSYSWMPGNFSGQSLSNLPAGTYTVTAGDSKGCSSTTTIVITQPAPLALTTSSVNSNCSLPNGQASVSVAGGTPNYSYQWFPSGGSSATATNLLAGPYTVTVTDQNGCTSTANVTVTDNTGPTVTVSSVTSVSCFGGANGTATAVVSGGAAPFSYAWSPVGGTAATAVNLPAGTYTVVATDANGCPSAPVVSPAVTQPSLIIISVVTSNVSCFAGTNGTAAATVSGGTPGYTYIWSPGGTTAPSVSNLTSGSYSVQVTDANSCTQTSAFNITQPAAPVSVNTSALPAACFGNAGGLSAGTYTVTATDLKGCTATSTAIITQPTALVLTAGSNNASCGTASGVAFVNVSGGTPLYAFQWSPLGGTNDTAAMVPPGTYTVTVTDNNSCSATTSIAVNNNPGPIASVSSSTNVSCFGGSNGTATASVINGSAPFTYSWAPQGGNAITATGLPAGTFTVTVTDVNGCISTASSPLITQPTLININVTTTLVSCFGGNDATATASAGGGTPGFTYLWLPSGISGSTISNLSAGTYTVQATDANSCTQSTTFTISQPSIVTAAISSSSNVSCFGGNNGSATVTGNGGTPFYTYNWLPSGGTNATAVNLSAGTYTVTITDTKGCSTTATVSITQPSQPLSATAAGSPTSCFGGSNGTATVTAVGGTPGYNYSWSPSGGNAATAAGLSAITYNILVTDANGCQTNTSVTISEPSPIVGTLTAVNPSCGFNNGSIVSAISGGTGPYSYSWSPGGATTPDIGSIGPGTYNLIITDGNNCTFTISSTINNIAGPNASVTSTSNVSCFGGNNGTATASASAGSPPYTFSWSPFGGTAATGTGFTIGTYTVSVTDSLGCISTATANITEPTLLGINIDSVGTLSCNGSNNGSISVSGTGGTTPYSYSWSPITSTSPTVSGLASGTYTVNVTDGNSCATSITVTVSQPATLGSSIGTVINATCFNSSNGSATANVTGGTIPYSFIWSDGQTGSTAMNLIAGNYSVTITDANNCTTTNNVTITQPTQVITTAGQNDTICLGSSGSVTATATGGVGNYYYAWQPGPVINSGTLNITPTSTTQYIVVAYDQDGCAGTPDSVSGVVYHLTGANINAIAYTPICPGQVSPVYVETYGVNGPLTYSWNNGLGNGPGAYLVTPTTPTTYIVTVTNSCGTSVSDSVSITFNPPPTIVLSSDTNSVCVPSVVQFNDNSITGNVTDPIIAWNWNFGDGTTSSLQNPTHVYPSAGTFPVTVTVTTSGGCTNNNSSAPYLIHAYPFPVAAFNLNSTNLDLPYDALVTSNQSVGASTYYWTFGDGGSSTLFNPTYMYSSVGIYPVQLIATSGFGCSDTAYAEVTTNTDVVFPNVFTPNVDGSSGGFYDITSLTNDVFFPYTSGVIDFKLQIFNRWGELIFETRDIKQGWDGYYRGQLCQQDVYIWKAYVKLNNGKTFNKTGDVTLLR